MAFLVVAAAREARAHEDDVEVARYRECRPVEALVGTPDRPTLLGFDFRAAHDPRVLLGVVTGGELRLDLAEAPPPGLLAGALQLRVPPGAWRPFEAFVQGEPWRSSGFLEPSLPWSDTWRIELSQVDGAPLRVLAACLDVGAAAGVHPHDAGGPIDPGRPPDAAGPPRDAGPDVDVHARADADGGRAAGSADEGCRASGALSSCLAGLLILLFAPARRRR